MQQVFYGIIVICLMITKVVAADKVVLQLKWEHEFQFAGYYAALWQGFYKDAGIEVEIRPLSRPDGTIVSAVSELQNGNAQFALGGLDILTAKQQGLDVVVLSSIFQKSQNAVFSLAGTPIDNLSKLAKLRIGAAEQVSGLIEVKALFMTQGFDLKKINFVKINNPINALINNDVDAIITYDIYATTKFKEIGVKHNRLDPADFGMNFYSDALFTSAQFAQNNPELVSRFIEASLKGWKYALKHKEAIARKIVDELPRHLYNHDDPFNYNLQYANLIEPSINHQEQEIGVINPYRWMVMNDSMRKLGLVKTHLIKEEFFFNPPEKNSVITDSGWLFVLLMFLFVITYLSWYKRSIILTLLCILILAYVIDMQIIKVLNNQHKEHTKVDLFRQLTSISARLEGDLQTNLSMLGGFAAYISAEPDLEYDDFRHYAQEIFRKEPMLINFAAAKDLIVNYVYPIEGNEKVIGLDYLNIPSQKDMVKHVVNTGQLLVDGPIELVQGGKAFIGRAPIYTGNGVERRLWGIISAPLDADKLYLQSGVLASTKSFNLAIRNIDAFGNYGPVFFGNEAVFNDANNIQATINVGSGSWQLAATSNDKHSDIETNIIIFRLVLVLSTLIICIFSVVRTRQQSEQLKLQAAILTNKELLENVGQVAKIGGWKLDKDLKFLEWSHQASRLLNKPVDYMPTSLDDISGLFDIKTFIQCKKNIIETFATRKAFELDLELTTDKKESTWLRVIVNLSEQSGESVVTGTMQDVTDKVLSSKLIEHQATYDALTNLPNRVLFNDRLIKAMEAASRKTNKVAVLFIDLDRFKPINDNHGHQMGDKLLVAAADRIKNCVREYDTVSRLSGDEFGVIISDISKFSDALHISDKIQMAMQQSYSLEDKLLYCSASIGISMFPDDGLDAESLIQKADQAMYEVKNSGRNGCQFYTKEMQVKSEYRHNLLNDLIIAIANNVITPYFQPIVNLQTNKLSKCESLARWQKEDGSFVPPDVFIELAEESGLVNKIDLAMLENSARELIALNNHGANVGLTINISPRIFHTKDKALDRWMVCIRQLSQQLDITIEITERLLTHDSEKALDVLNDLKKYGVKIAIDDFGTGYSSLSYLIKFPVDIIKIDRSFVSEIGRDKSVDMLIETILLMAKKLGLKVVAEGIETQEQLDFLILHRCDFGQGYLLGKPMPASDFLEFAIKG